jgi:hypothetical protein
MWVFSRSTDIQKQANGIKEARSNMNHSENKQSHTKHRLPINVDLVAITLGLALAALVRFNLIHQISF